MLNLFFKNVGPFDIKKLLTNAKIENKENFQKDKIYNVSDLVNATNKDLTFFHSKNYSSLASKTKASYCVTLDSLSQFLPDSCKKIIVKNVLLSMAKITKEFYPDSKCATRISGVRVDKGLDMNEFKQVLKDSRAATDNL